MELLVERKYKKDKYTIGNLSINGEYFCNTLEDKDRNLSQSMSEDQIKKIKVYGETAIPLGRYKVERTWSPKYGKKMIEIKNVPGFSGIRIHAGNSATSSTGCILVGENKIKGQLIHSKYHSDLLDQKVANALANKEDVYITIK